MLSISTYTDCELLQAIRQDDKKAFAELFRRHFKKVYTMVYARLRSEDVAKEIVQDLFISLWEKRSNLLIHHLSTYLYTAAKNRVLNYIESQIVRKKHWDYYKRLIPQQDHVTEKDVELNELMEVIEIGVNRLPEKSKKVFMLNRLEGRSIPEIANILNLSEKAIHYHLRQSVKKLRMHLKNYILVGSLLVDLFF